MSDYSNKYDATPLESVPVSDALIEAAGKGNLAKVREVLSSGGHPNGHFNDGYTALMAAAHTNHPEVITALVDAQASLDQADKCGMTALMFAAEEGALEAAKVLLERGANANIQIKDELSPYFGWTALIFAAEGGTPEFTNLLLQHDADPDAQDSEGETALMKAAAGGFLPVVESLISAGAELKFKNENGDTALQLADEMDHADIVEALRKAGAEG